MQITEVRVKLAQDRGEKLQAFATITFDNAFVVRDIKVIKGPSGYFVAMPSRKLTVRCSACGHKNHLRASYCNQCGKKLKKRPIPVDERGRAKLHADIAHPINQECRAMIQEAVVREFTAELERAKQPGYQAAADYEDDAGPEDDDYPAAEEVRH